MSFFHSGLEESSINEKAQRAVESHGKPEYILNPEERAMRKKEHTGIELTDAELAVVIEMTSKKISEMKDRIGALERSLEGSLPNRQNTEAELEQLEKRLDFVENNLFEKLTKDRLTSE